MNFIHLQPYNGSVENAIKYSPISFNVHEINNSEELLLNPNKLTSIKENLKLYNIDFNFNLPLPMHHLI